MVMLTLEIDEALFERLQAKAVAEDKPLEEVMIAGLEKTAESDDDIATDTSGRAFLLALGKLAEELDLRSGRKDVSENFDAVLAELEDVDKKPL